MIENRKWKKSLKNENNEINEKWKIKMKDIIEKIKKKMKTMK